MPGPISNQARLPCARGQGARQIGALALDPVENFFERAGGQRFCLSNGQIGKHALPVFDLCPQCLVRFQALREGVPVLLAEQPKGMPAFPAARAPSARMRLSSRRKPGPISTDADCRNEAVDQRAPYAGRRNREARCAIAHLRFALRAPGMTLLPLLRRELHFRRGGADVGVDLGFELGKVLLEHADQRCARSCRTRPCPSRC